MYIHNFSINVDFNPTNVWSGSFCKLYVCSSALVAGGTQEDNILI